jgi:hypothetical protein
MLGWLTTAVWAKMLWSHNKQLALLSQRGFDLVGMTAAALDNAYPPMKATVRLSTRN